ncbi:MAG: hypothetical protein HYY87_00910 [Candidatus Levybacteria bacterium]|nr:hypothetical protein [Candidatus Levybacteria bacterium]MBI2189914.1 hypothetical protein [Candidatus Levybacteria bacterium]MBI3069849.1 hypothetical protein [Candidatus Levybacteria bacterium]MBI3093045.1 hypothetical protein [Candidatus Levybacteria bacterium]
MITNSIKKHTGYYFSLIIILALGIFLSLQTSGDRQLQMLIMVMTVFFYVAWGILHHLLEHDLNIKIVIEYVLIGSLAMSIVLFLVRG